MFYANQICYPNLILSLLLLLLIPNTILFFSLDNFLANLDEMRKAVKIVFLYLFSFDEYDL